MRTICITSGVPGNLELEEKVLELVKSLVETDTIECKVIENPVTVEFRIDWKPGPKLNNEQFDRLSDLELEARVKGTSLDTILRQMFDKR